MRKDDPEGRSQLHYAAAENDAALVSSLISRGEDVNLKDKQGFTPLHMAAQESSLQAADLLLQHGAYVDSPNTFGNTPLFTAVFNSRGRGDMIKLLRSKGADPHYVNKFDQTPLGLARLIGNYDIARFFADLE